MTQQYFLTLEEVKAEELELLLKLDTVCKENGFRYSLVGGTLLGAVRHKGFIPWDDDIDVAMPRPDFDKFVALWQAGGLPEGTSLEFRSCVTSAPVFLKFVNENILLKERYANGINHLWVDVFPIDGMPTVDDENSALMTRAAKLRRLFLLSCADSDDGKTAFKRAFKKVVVPIMRFFDSRAKIGRKLDGLSRSIPFGSTGYCGCIAWGLYGVGERYRDDAFDRVVSVEFEGYRLPAIAYWDEYLTGIYGDYMQLPPVEQRKTHELEAWRIS